jgi:hypothetical protein
MAGLKKRWGRINRPYSVTAITSGQPDEGSTVRVDAFFGMYESGAADVIYTRRKYKTTFTGVLLSLKLTRMPSIFNNSIRMS